MPPASGPRAGALDLREKASEQWDAEKYKDCERTSLQAFAAFAALGDRGGMAWALAQHADAVDRQGQTLDADRERERSAAMFKETLRSAADSVPDFERLAFDYDSVLYGIWGGAMRRNALGRARRLAEERVSLAESYGPDLDEGLRPRRSGQDAQSLRPARCGRSRRSPRRPPPRHEHRPARIAPRPQPDPGDRIAFERREGGGLKSHESRPLAMPNASPNPSLTPPTISAHGATIGGTRTSSR